MKKKRLNKRAENEGGNTVVGLVLLALVLVAIIYITTKYGGEIISWINNKVKKGLASAFSAPPSLTRGSEANFDRLNDELGTLLKSTKKIDHIIVPYAIGQFRLVGFNKDPYNSINKLCFGENILSVLPDKCKKASCLCLCLREESCICEAYPEVDYIFTTNNQNRNEGNKMPLNEETMKDPITGEEVNCLMIKGAYDEKEEVSYMMGNSWWRSNMVYIEKIEHEGKRYIFFSRMQDIEYNERMYGGCDESSLKLENCGSVSTCYDYKKADLGCDPRYNCQNNVCESLGLNCNVRENPYAQTEEDSWLCLDEEESIEQFCLAGPENETAPIEGRTGMYYWDAKTAICYTCLGLGQQTLNADNWGWKQDQIEEAYCKN